MTRRIKIFDTTLRDGEQSPGASMNMEQKMEVAKQLARLKVDVIEAGFAASSPGDFESVKTIAETIKGPVIASLSRCRDEDIDAAWDAVQFAKKPMIHTFIATSDIHIEKKFRKTREEILDMAIRGVKRAKSHCELVEFSAEDAGRSDIDYLCQVVEAVIDAGATTVNIPDTVGYAIPTEWYERIATLFRRVPNIKKAIISVHCHNDLGLATANSLAAVQAGANQIECTINGLGERAGNASLEEVVMAIATRQDIFNAVTGINTKEICRSSRLVSDVTGLPVQVNKAIVGKNAFAHEAGIHQDGVLKERTTYEIMDPFDVGWTGSGLVLGRRSGRHAFEERLKSLGYHLNKSDLDKAFVRFKETADKKKEIFDEDLEAIVADEVYTIPEAYKLEYMTVITSLEGIPTATIKIVGANGELAECGMGVGSIDAVYNTIDRMLGVSPELIDYIVKSVTGGTDALGEVTVRLGDGKDVYTGKGMSLDIVEASAKAYIQAVNKLVYFKTKRKRAEDGSNDN
ncbi:MAG TPA: 2-isopropylmalate synthase [Armatimonadota bacterium]